MDIAQDQASMLPAGDLDKLEKREREAFHELQERIVGYLLQGSNDFQRQFPGLRVEWRFQVDVYQTKQQQSGRVTYSSQVF